MNRISIEGVAMKEYQLFVNGAYRPSNSGKTADSINPATGEIYARVDQANTADVAEVLDIAWEAFQGWKAARPSEREAVFIKAAQIMEARKSELQDILIDEAGSTALKAGYETAHTPQHTLSMAGECRRVMGDTYWSDYPGVESYCIRRPLGLVLAISPFNFPLLLSNRKIGWAIAAGNCVILKPSEVTPVIGLKLGEIYSEAGLPDGVLNVLPAQGADLGDSLIADPRVKKVAFTGSSRVGKAIATSCAEHHTKCTLEMGGKNPLIVLADADLDYAVNAAAFSNFMHQGQVCMTGSRVIVEEAVYDTFVEKFTEKVSNIKCGDPREPGVLVGPLIRPEQPAFIQSQVDLAVAQGARLMTGGSSQDSYYQPTVLADVTPEMSIFRTECFGPAASVIKAKDHVHALELANDSQYGLSAAVITNDLQKSMFMIDGLESGMVHINGPTIRDEPGAPFGGVKDSGSGREGGTFSMDDFTELKWVTIQRGQQQFPV
jgi:vanillin dehydrogenase